MTASSDSKQYALYAAGQAQSAAEDFATGLVAAFSITLSGHVLSNGSVYNLVAGDVSGLAAIATSGSATDLTTGTIPNARIVALPNANLANSAITLNGHSVSLGGSLSIAPGDLALTNTHIYVGNVSNVAVDVAMSGDATMANTGAISVTKTGGVSFATSATTDTTSATNITSGTLPNARIVALPNANLANSSVTISGHSLSLGGTLALAAADVSGLAAIATSGSASDLGTGTIPNARIVALPNANLANSSITLNGHAVSLGGSLSLAPGDFTLTSAHIFVGNGSNVAADVAMTGDVSITNAGVTSVTSAVGATFATTGPIFQLTGGTAVATVVNGEGIVTSTLYSANAVSATTAPNIVAKRSRGVLATPAKCNSGDDLGRYNFQGYQDGTGAFGNGARIQVTTAEAFTSTTNLGTVGKFLACPTASGTLVESLRWAGTHAAAPIGFSIGTTAAPARMSHVTVDDAVTAAVTFVERLTHTSSGTAAASFGVGQEFEIENASGTNRVAGSTAVRYIDATNAAEVAEFVIQTMDAGTLADKVRVTGKGYVISPGNTRVTTDVTTTSATLADVTGLSVNVRAGKTYAFEARLYLSAAALLTPNFAIAGTATATDIRMNNRLFNDPASGLTSNFTTTTALATTSGFTVTINGASYVEITGTITVNAGGTLTVQHKTSTSTLTTKRGSTFIVTEID